MSICSLMLLEFAAMSIWTYKFIYTLYTSKSKSQFTLIQNKIYKIQIYDLQYNNWTFKKVH